ncbi:uncharacterized protein [Diadema antillarum]|uniref:uncharacterized protein n=1 Tax=Diadema antillarum TaxID=105358 RepID=UPI003A8BD433
MSPWVRFVIFILFFVSSPPGWRRVAVAMGDNGRSVPFSAEEARKIVDIHNQKRGNVTPSAANMEFMSWDEDLASAALAWAARCTLTHGIPENSTISRFLGQNIWAGYVLAGNRSPDLLSPFMAWINEDRFYDYDTNSCAEGQICGHYTQIVWASTNKVGCGRARCSVGDNTFFDRWIVVCNYLPGGNIRGMLPYVSGPSCTRCASGNGECFENMCRPCADHSGPCECRLTCQNCGTLDARTCTCSCAKGWHGNECEKPCVDTHEYCWKSPGWPGPFVCPIYSYIPRYCPLMCGVCEAEDPDFTCESPTTDFTGLTDVITMTEATVSATSSDIAMATTTGIDATLSPTTRAGSALGESPETLTTHDGARGASSGYSNQEETSEDSEYTPGNIPHPSSLEGARGQMLNSTAKDGAPEKLDEEPRGLIKDATDNGIRPEFGTSALPRGDDGPASSDTTVDGSPTSKTVQWMSSKVSTVSPDATTSSNTLLPHSHTNSITTARGSSTNSKNMGTHFENRVRPTIIPEVETGTRDRPDTHDIEISTSTQTPENDSETTLENDVSTTQHTPSDVESSSVSMSSHSITSSGSDPQSTFLKETTDIITTHSTPQGVSSFEHPIEGTTQYSKDQDNVEYVMSTIVTPLAVARMPVTSNYNARPNSGAKTYLTLPWENGVNQNALPRELCVDHFTAMESVGQTLFLFRGQYLWRVNISDRQRAVSTQRETLRSYFGVALEGQKVTAAFYRSALDEWVLFTYLDMHVITNIANGSDDGTHRQRVTEMGIPLFVTIDAALYDAELDKSYLFTGRWVWRYDNRRGVMDAGYPRRSHREFSGLTRRRPTSAFSYLGDHFLLYGLTYVQLDLQRRTALKCFLEIEEHVFDNVQLGNCDGLKHAVCPDGWLAGTNKCYKNLNQHTDWTRARTWCSSLAKVAVGGGERYPSLVAFESDEELEDFRTLFSSLGVTESRATAAMKTAVT